MNDDALETAPVARPGVYPWFVAYCWFMVPLYLLCVISGVALLVVDEAQLASYQAKESVTMLRLEGAVLTLIGLPLVALHAAAPFFPRRPWAWIVDLVLLCISILTICCMPLSAPLLLFWLRENTQVYFGRSRRTVD